MVISICSSQFARHSSLKLDLQIFRRELEKVVHKHVLWNVCLSQVNYFCGATNHRATLKNTARMVSFYIATKQGQITGLQNSIPIPPKKYSSPYTTIPVCLRYDIIHSVTQVQFSLTKRHQFASLCKKFTDNNIGCECINLPRKAGESWAAKPRLRS